VGHCWWDRPSYWWHACAICFMAMDLLDQPAHHGTILRCPVSISRCPQPENKIATGTSSGGLVWESVYPQLHGPFTSWLEFRWQHVRLEFNCGYLPPGIWDCHDCCLPLVRKTSAVSSRSTIYIPSSIEYRSPCNRIHARLG